MTHEPHARTVLNSADLARLREFLATASAFSAAVGNAIQVRMVLDTNAILRDLIYLSERREKAGIRTSIQELISSQTLIPYAPSVAVQEVEKYLPRIAKKRRIAVEHLQEVWADYRMSLHFCDLKLETSGEASNVRDPKDLPFIQLAVAVGAGGIVTNDKDIPAMGGNPVHLDCIIHLRDYARAKHLELTFHLGGVLMLVVGVGAIVGLVKLLQGIIQAIGRSPAWFKLGLAAAVVIAIAHPRSRTFLVERFNALKTNIKRGALNLREPLGDVGSKFADAQKSASIALSKAQETISGNKRIALSILVYAICLASTGPLPMAEIERKVLVSGYKTRSKTFRNYLLRVLKQDTRLHCTKDGRWGLVQA